MSDRESGDEQPQAQSRGDEGWWKDGRGAGDDAVASSPTEQETEESGEGAVLSAASSPTEHETEESGEGAVLSAASSPTEHETEESGEGAVLSVASSHTEQEAEESGEGAVLSVASSHTEHETEESGEGAVLSGSGEEELATKTLQIQSKRFYLDVKQNRRGRFIKIAEVGSGGKKSRLLLAMSTAAEFRDHLTEFSEHYASLGPPNPDNLPEDGKLKSEVIIKDNRRYYLDLKENQRGRFLRVSQIIGRSNLRSQIAIPAQGMIEFRDALTDLLDEFGTDDQEGQGDLPEPRSMRVENKMFYFDVGQNRRGVFMRVSEVRSNFRTAVTIPERSWVRFRDILTDFIDKMNNKEPELEGN